jgi:putative salt-induced outer membrane protein
MRRWIPSLATACLTLAGHIAHAAPLPPSVAEVIDAAADDPDTLEAVAKAAKKANPGSIAEIDAQVKALTAQAAAEKEQQAAEAGLFEGWTGKGEFGGSISTGNTNDQGFSASLAFDKQTPLWGQDLNIAVDHKREDEKTTKDRYFGAYSINRNFSPRFYAVGVLWGERDRFAGVNFRFSESIGLGYRLADSPNLKFRVEAGPALRQSEYLTTGRENTIAARGAGYLTWKVAPRLEFSQSLVAYLESQNSTLLATTALTTKLQDQISARGSYEVRHEQDPPADRENTDTTTRLTLIFSF